MMGVTRRAPATAVGAAVELEDKPPAIASASPKTRRSLPPTAPPTARRRPLGSPAAAKAETSETTEAAAGATQPPLAALPAALPAAAPPKSRRGRKRLLHDEGQRKTRRKLQCKLNQRRYRARQRDMISTLSLETETLQGRIQELQAHAAFLRAYLAEGSAALGVVDRARLVVGQFFRVFRHGFALHSVEDSDGQERFLKQVAAPGEPGARHADALLLQLKRYASYHAEFELLPAADPTVVYDGTAGEGAVGAGDGDVAVVLESRGTLRLRVSRDTAMLVYPHILADDALSARVVGCEIAPAFAAAMHFDARARLARLELRVDFCAAFMARLGSAEAAAALLGPALITRDSELGMDPQGALAQESALTRGGSKQLSLRFILL